MSSQEPKGKKKTEIVVGKVAEKIGGPEVYNKLKDLKGEDLQALMVSLYADRVADLQPKDLLKQAIENRFLTIAPVSQKDIIEFDGIAMKVLPEDVESIQFAPLGPLGTNSVLCGLDQKTVIATSRNIEVIADCSPLLAIEYAKKRKAGQSGTVSMFTSERVTRAQNFNIKGFTSHFQAGFLFSADKFGGRWELLGQLLEKHISFYLDLIQEGNASGKYEAKKIKVSISNLMIMEALIAHYKIEREKLMTNTQTRGFDVFKDYEIQLPNRLKITEEIGVGNLSEEHLEELGIAKAYEFLMRNGTAMISRLMEKYPEVDFDFDFSRIAGIGYYDNLCLKIAAENEDGESYPLADGGFTDWTKQLVQSDKELCLTSGFGSELFINKFKKK